jgi:hypothetical protein
MTLDVGRQVHAVRHLGSLLMPCALCGATLPHSAVEPQAIARLIFRASERFGRVWIPLAHSKAGLCPDPGPETVHFWTDDERRESYKRARREASPVNGAGWEP